MKKILTVIVGMLIVNIIFSQLVSLDKLTRSYESIYVEKYPELKSLKIPTHYNESTFSLSEEYALLDNVEVFAIDLVYTEYPSGVSFEALNTKRLTWLYNQFPKLKNTNIICSLIGQTSATEKIEAEKLFHGFVIYYREKATAESMKKEVDVLRKIVDPKIEKEKSTDLLKSEMGTTGLDYIRYSTYTCYNEDLKKRWETEYKLKVEVLTAKQLEARVGNINHNSLTCSAYIFAEIIKDTSFFSYKVDSSVYKALDRNKWKNMMVCADVTGSMSPYTVQLLLWMKLNTGKVSMHQFVAFNDGDAMPDEKKIIGKTGGIYNIESNRYEQVSELIYATMMKGGGGDAPENNIEALIKGIELSATADNYVLIADNWAPVKDISLLNKITKPVKVIICGSNGYIHPDYLNIAYKTGGSVHTMEEDITELMKLREGDIFTFKGVKYKIVDGKFVSETYKLY